MVAFDCMDIYYLLSNLFLQSDLPLIYLIIMTQKKK